MATATVIARPGKVTSDTVVITFHAVPQETHNLNNEITDYPVEEGFNPSDHSRPRPDQVTMECLISNTPINESQATEAIKSGGFTFQTTTALAQAAGAIGALDGFAQGEWKKLRAIRDAGTLVTLATTMGDYKSMGIESLSLPRSSKYYDAIKFTMTLKYVRVVQNKLTKVVKGPPQAQTKRSTGHKTTTTATETDIDPARKVISGVGKIGGFVTGGF